MSVKTVFGADVSAKRTRNGDVLLIISADDDYSGVTLSNEAALALSALLATTAKGGDGDDNQ